MIAQLFAWWHRRVRAHYVIRRYAGSGLHVFSCSCGARWYG